MPPRTRATPEEVAEQLRRAGRTVVHPVRDKVTLASRRRRANKAIDKLAGLAVEKP